MSDGSIQDAMGAMGVCSIQGESHRSPGKYGPPSTLSSGISYWVASSCAIDNNSRTLASDQSKISVSPARAPDTVVTEPVEKDVPGARVAAELRQYRRGTCARTWATSGS